MFLLRFILIFLFLDFILVFFIGLNFFNNNVDIIMKVNINIL